MNKTFRLYGIIFAIVLAILAVLEFSKTEITDWRKNYDPSKKTPFGLYILDQELPTLLGDSLRKISNSPYQYYSINKDKSQHNILIFQKNIDDESLKKILQQVTKGASALIISEEIYGKALDTLQLNYPSAVGFDEKSSLQLTDSKFSADSCQLDKLPDMTGFTTINKQHQILGTTRSKKDSGANFIKIQFGKGNIYIHTEPLAFTNYYLLKTQNRKYVENVFSYLPKQETIWFTDSGEFQSQSAMRFIFANPPLKYAWWLFLGGLLLFTIFNAKRKQRIVPIIEPLKNKSVEFVKSIGNLYLQEGDFHDMMSKKAQYFLHRIRLELLIDTNKLDEDFAKKLQLKTGKSPEKIEEAIALIKKANDPYEMVMKEDLIRINTLLDEILN